jgi:predicted acetyltransferase
LTFRSITRDEIPLLADLLGRAFRYDAASRMAESLRNDSHRYPFSSGYIWEEEGHGTVAGMVMFERSMSLAGGEVVAGLLASVAVPPDQRRRGYAGKLLSAGLEEMRGRKLPLSLLFPYSIPFYNRLGYGVGSNVWSLELPLNQLDDFSEVTLTRAMTHDDLPAMQSLYQRERGRRNGWFSRTEWEWHHRVLDVPRHIDWPNRVEGVVVPGEGDELRGYLTYSLGQLNPNEREQALAVQEWVAEDEEAWRALAGFVAGQRAQAEFMRYTAPVGFPLVHALKEWYTFRNRRNTEFIFRDAIAQGPGLMVRLVHLEQALKQRAYPAWLQGECIISMQDRQLPANEQPLHFYLDEGRAAVAPAHHGRRGIAPTAVADARTWSEIYAATLSPGHARLLGRLDADDPTVDFLTAAFAGEPWFLPRADWF